MQGALLMKSELITDVINIEPNRKVVSSIVYEFHNICESYDVIIPAEYRKDCIDDIIAFYEKYLKTHKQKLVSIDYYKIVSWYAVFVAVKMFNFYQQKGLKNDSWIKVIGFAVSCMIDELKFKEKRTIERAYKNKIIAMVACEIKGNSDFGIGKNGLYMLMLTARKVKAVSE